MKIKQRLYDASFILPGIIIFSIFVLIPLFLSLYFSFTNWNGINVNYKWVGLRNFIQAFHDRAFLESLSVTAGITIITTLIGNVLGLITAVALSRPGKLFKVSKALVFIPAILSPVVVSFIWAYMTQTHGGIINGLLSFICIAPIDLYQSERIVVIMVSWVISWAALGFYVTVYIANLTSIPEEIYEAANIDGATPLQRFFKITLPLLEPAIAICSVTAIIWGLKQYDFVKVMVPGYIQSITVYAVERAFDYNMFGYSSSIIFILLLLTLVISVIQLKISRRKEVNE